MEQVDGPIHDVPREVAQLGEPVLQRQVFLQDPSQGVPCVRHRAGVNGTSAAPCNLVYAASWWNAHVAKQYLKDASQPIWASLSQGRTELYRDIREVTYGKCPALEDPFGCDGPFWGRDYVFWHGGKPLTVIHEVFSPALSQYLGPMMPERSSTGEA